MKRLAERVIGEKGGKNVTDEKGGKALQLTSVQSWKTFYRCGDMRVSQLAIGYGFESDWLRGKHPCSDWLVHVFAVSRYSYG